MPGWDVRFDLHINLSAPELVRGVAEAQALASVIRDIPIPPHAQRELDTVNILRAVRGTTAIEGADASPEEVRRIMESPDRPVLPPSRARDEQEVRNAESAMRYIAEAVENDPHHPLTHRLVCDLHRRLTENIDYPKNIPGRYRAHAVHAGNYQPPQTGEEVKSLMNQFVGWANSPPATKWDPIVQAVAAHFYLISIHPFGDGNGRTSRAVESFLLYKGKVNARGFYSLANFYYQNRSEYVRHLDSVRFNPNQDLTPFVIFAVDGLVSELKYVHAGVIAAVKLISFRDYAREQLQVDGLLGTRGGNRAYHLLLNLGTEPTLLRDVRALDQYKNVTSRTVLRDVKLLSERDLVVVEKGRLRLNVDVMSRFLV